MIFILFNLTIVKLFFRQIFFFLFDIIDLHYFVKKNKNLLYYLQYVFVFDKINLGVKQFIGKEKNKKCLKH